MITKSVDCTVQESREITTPGTIVYTWDGEGRRFPEDVRYVYIRMPVTYREWCQIRHEPEGELSPEFADVAVDIGWTTDHPKNAGHVSTHRWKLSGTVDKPTLHPSLNWVDVWHGWLRDGRLESC